MFLLFILLSVSFSLARSPAFSLYIFFNLPDAAIGTSVQILLTFFCLQIQLRAFVRMGLAGLLRSHFIDSTFSPTIRPLLFIEGIDTQLDIRLQVDVKDQNMVKHALGIFHRISTLDADPMMNSVELCISYGKFPRNA